MRGRDDDSASSTNSLPSLPSLPSLSSLDETSVSAAAAAIAVAAVSEPPPARAEPAAMLRSVYRVAASADEELQLLRESASNLLGELTPRPWPHACKPATVLSICLTLRDHLVEQNEQLRAHNHALRSLLTDT